MEADFSNVHNFYERPVFETIGWLANQYPGVPGALLPDVACIALNRVGARYIRHDADLSFYMTESERARIDTTVRAAVAYAFEFVQARTALGART